MHSHLRDFSVDRRLLFFCALAVVIGMVSTLAAWVLLNAIHFFTNLFFFQELSFVDRSPSENTLGLWVIALPVVGGLIAGLVARYGSDKIRGHGIPEAIEAILFRKSQMSPKVAVLKPLTSGIVIGSGGPFGAEGPIIMTGGAIGSLIAQYFRITAAERKVLLVAGATAGMTAVFGTPVAAVMLAVELLLFELRPRSLLPVIMACATAAFCRPFLLEGGPLFAMQTAVPVFQDFAICLAAGVLCGALATAMSRCLYLVEDWFSSLPLHWMWWPAIGGLIVGIGGYFEPRALGVGYDVIADLLGNHLAVTAVASLLAVKAVIWIFALGSGTSGGVLAPLLILGAGFGTLVASVAPGSDANLWPLVCMAAVLAGVLGAPLTAAIFGLGLTGDFNALLPLLLATGVSYGFTILVMRRSIMTEKIARRGLHIYREYGVDPQERAFVADVMSADPLSLSGSMTFEAAHRLYFGPEQRYRFYPVVDDDGAILGMMDRNLLARGLRLHPAASLASVFEQTSQVALTTESCQSIGRRMADGNLECLPVVADLQSRRLIGVVSRSDLLKPSRAAFHEEHVRERLIGS